ncbi:flavin reductase, partial [Escherichia coli O145:H28]|nr:flavin reductase [Escherichia coli O145:H28]
EALVSFDCRISQVVSVGTHDILFCAIEAIHRHATPYGLVWFDRSYHALMRPAC